MNFFGVCAFPLLALMLGLAALGLRDIVFAVDRRDWPRLMRGLAFLVAPVALSALCVLAAAVPGA